MKTLYLLRHAKSSWDHPGLRDHERPLANRGRKAAPRIGRYMREHDMAPELVVCSTSQRTRQTWDLVREELGGEPEVVFTEDVYHASAGHLILTANQLPDPVGHAMIIGHNPGMHAAAELFAGEGDDARLDLLGYKFPTGALAVLDFDVEHWRDARANGATLRAFVLPREL